MSTDDAPWILSPPDPVGAPVDTATHASGRDLLAAIAEGRLPPPPAATLLELELERVGDGTTTFGFVARPEIGNPDRAHGGILAAIADLAVATAVWTVHPVDARVVTADLHVSFMRGIVLDHTRYTCTGRVTHLGRTQANALADICDVDGELFVQAMGTCRITLPSRPDAHDTVRPP